MKDRINSFEDLIAWQRARELHRLVHAATTTPFCDQYQEMRSQLRRASLSAMTNIAEGFERGYRGEFHHFLVIAKGSAGEVRSLLVAAADVNCLPAESLAALVAEADRVCALIGGLRRGVDAQRKKGPST